MLPDFRLVLASIATAVMVVTLGLGTIAAFRTGAVSGLPPMTKRTDPSFTDLGMRRQVPDPAAPRSDPGGDNGADSSWTVVTVPEGARAPSGVPPSAVHADPLATSALGPLPASREGRGFVEQRLIVDVPGVIAGDPKSASAPSPADRRHEDDLAAAPSAATAAPAQGTGRREAADRDPSSELTVASVMQTRPRNRGAQAPAKAEPAKSRIANQKARRVRLVHWFRPMRENFAPTDDYRRMYGPERSFGPDQSFGPDRPFTNTSRPVRSYSSDQPFDRGMASSH
jgi:hypothetical protein